MYIRTAVHLSFAIGLQQFLYLNIAIIFDNKIKTDNDVIR